MLAVVLWLRGGVVGNGVRRGRFVGMVTAGMKPMCMCVQVMGRTCVGSARVRRSVAIGRGWLLLGSGCADFSTVVGTFSQF